MACMGRVRRSMPETEAVLDRAPQAIAQKLHALRELLGLSQQELADRAGTSQGAVSRMEAGTCPDMTLRIVAGVFAALVIELLPMRDACSVEIESVIAVVTGIFPLLVENTQFTVFRDPDLVALVRGYTRLGAAQRKRLVQILGLVGLVDPADPAVVDPAVADPVADPAELRTG